MTNAERKTLVERLREENEWTNQRPYFHAHEKSLQAADQIEADGQRIAELEAALIQIAREKSVPYSEDTSVMAEAWRETSLERRDLARSLIPRGLYD